MSMAREVAEDQALKLQVVQLSSSLLEVLDCNIETCVEESLEVQMHFLMDGTILLLIRLMSMESVSLMEHHATTSGSMLLAEGRYFDKSVNCPCAHPT